MGMNHDMRPLILLLNASITSKCRIEQTAHKMHVLEEATAFTPKQRLDNKPAVSYYFYCM
jgi:hypothetical protein